MTSCISFAKCKCLQMHDQDLFAKVLIIVVCDVHANVAALKPLLPEALKRLRSAHGRQT